MNTSFFIFVTFWAIICTSFFPLPSAADDVFYGEIPLELRCSGCELTVKALHNMVVNRHKHLEAYVDKAIDSVCERDRFTSSEFNADKMVKVCKFIMKKHGGVMRYELLEHYQHGPRPTYLQFVQHVCLNVIRLCAGAAAHPDHTHDPEGDSLLHFDSKSHGFTVMPGKNIKMAKPVHELHDEL